MGLCRSGDAYCPGWLIAWIDAVQVDVADVSAGLNIFKIFGVPSSAITPATELL